MEKLLVIMLELDGVMERMTMNKPWTVLTAALIPFASAGIAVAIIPTPSVEAAAYNCDPYKEKDWGYIYCDSGKSHYATIGKCVYWIDGYMFVHYEYGDWAWPGVTASFVWCPDGTRLRRMFKVVA
jgi:hypothetical protein